MLVYIYLSNWEVAMIPTNISREHILKAIQYVDTCGIPKSRLSRKHSVKYNGRLYPPKYLISIANKYANDTELEPTCFSGGYEANSYLEKLGFIIVYSSSHAL